MKYRVGTKELSYEPDGESIMGSHQVLLHDAIDLTSNTPWSDEGFNISPLYSDTEFKAFFSETEQLLRSCWRRAGLSDADKVPLASYHTNARTFEMHLRCVNETKLISTELFPGGIERMEDRISQLCNVPLQALNPFDNQSVFHFRVIRPSSTDNNPLHRDVWLEDYADCINLYIPIAGSNEHSSLIILPGSHHWPENKIRRTVGGAKINGIQFNVPAVTSINGAYAAVRPNPRLNEVLVFSPYLIHGGAANLNENETRISIELRLWMKR